VDGVNFVFRKVSLKVGDFPSKSGHLKKIKV